MNSRLFRLEFRCLEDLSRRATPLPPERRRSLSLVAELDDRPSPLSAEMDGTVCAGTVSAQQYVYERPRARRKNFSITAAYHVHGKTNHEPRHRPCVSFLYVSWPSWRSARSRIARTYSVVRFDRFILWAKNNGPRITFD